VPLDTQNLKKSDDMNKLGFPVGLIYSLLEHLIIVTCCVFKYFRFVLNPKRFKHSNIHGPPGVQPEISSKEGWKKIPFLNENIPHLEGGRGGGY